jgi:hypothetical protein
MQTIDFLGPDNSRRTTSHMSRHEPSAVLNLLQIEQRERFGEAGSILNVEPIETSRKHLEQFQNFFGGLPVKITGRLVTDQKAWIGYESTSDRHLLLLPSGGLAWLVVNTMAQINNGESCSYMPTAFSLVKGTKEPWQLNILLGCKHGHQIIELKYESDLTGAPLR